MNASEAMIEIEHRCNRSRAAKFLYACSEILENKLIFDKCPDCSGLGGHYFYCHFCGGQGCRHCPKEECVTCNGKGMVWMDKDGNVIPEEDVL